jgi:hypothetical protein
MAEYSAITDSILKKEHPERFVNYVWEELANEQDPYIGSIQQ